MANRKPIKWYGGKEKIADEILTNIPAECTTYIEPFLGGGSVLMKAKEYKGWDSMLVSDMNTELINFWQTTSNPYNHPELLTQFAICEEKYNADPEPTFLSYRASIPRGDIQAAVRFHLLNQTGFNGLYRLNKAGKCNTPWGKKTTYRGLDLSELRSITTLFENTVLKLSDYSKLEIPSTPAFIYLDPPYIPVNNKSIVTYGCQSFNWIDFQSWVQDLHRAGHKIVLSHTDHTDINELFWFLNHRRVLNHRHLSASKSESRQIKSEVLYSNFKP